MATTLTRPASPPSSPPDDAADLASGSHRRTSHDSGRCATTGPRTPTAARFGVNKKSVYNYLTRDPNPVAVADVDVPLPVWSVTDEDARMLGLCLEYGLTEGSRLFGWPRSRVQGRLRLILGGDSITAMLEAAMHLGWLRLPHRGETRIRCCEHHGALDEPGRRGRPPVPFPHRPIALAPDGQRPAPVVRRIDPRQHMALIAEAYARSAVDSDRPAA